MFHMKTNSEPVLLIYVLCDCKCIFNKYINLKKILSCSIKDGKVETHLRISTSTNSTLSIFLPTKSIFLAHSKSTNSQVEFTIKL